jgi:hypothetical protein
MLLTFAQFSTLLLMPRGAFYILSFLLSYLRVFLGIDLSVRPRRWTSACCVADKRKTIVFAASQKLTLKGL